MPALDTLGIPTYARPMASLARTQAIKTEVRFWACFAVAFALLAQVLFPVQAMANASGQRFMLCAEQSDTTPQADTLAAELVSKTVKKDSYQGLKCADCVLASITAIEAPVIYIEPAIYRAVAAIVTPERIATPVKARAPPRPHSCGPPSQI